jgi:hypothetical protein
MITETDQLAQALNDAAKRWPADRASRAKLLLHLVDEGHRALIEAEAKDREDRLAAIRRTSGAATGAYESGHLDRLREDWPA